jgi:hypothetical protein
MYTSGSDGKNKREGYKSIGWLYSPQPTSSDPSLQSCRSSQCQEASMQLPSVQRNCPGPQNLRRCPQKDIFCRFLTLRGRVDKNFPFIENVRRNSRFSRAIRFVAVVTTIVLAVADPSVLDASPVVAFMHSRRAGVSCICHHTNIHVQAPTGDKQK